MENSGFKVLLFAWHCSDAPALRTEETITAFSEEVIKIISNIPQGRVGSYARIAEIAGNPRAARQVARLLHSSSSKYSLPWHRVVASSGSISLKDSAADLQRQLLEDEGIEFGINGRINMETYCI